MALLGRMYARLESIVDWKKIERLHLHRIVTGMLIFDFVFSCIILIPSSIFHFLYLSNAGRDGFVDKKWWTYVDIYKFRRYQPWELLSPVDWQVPRHVYIENIRQILNDSCSRHEAIIITSSFGATGDYLKEVAGHPNRSGYNARMKIMIRLWMTTFEVMYFTSPVLLLGMWWKRSRENLILAYVLIQLLPMFFLVALCALANTHLMCALDIVFDAPIVAILIIFTCSFWLYQLLKYFVILIFRIDQHMAKKRKEYGFRRHRQFGIRRKVGQSGSHASLHDGTDLYYDVEKAVSRQKRTVEAGKQSKQSVVYGQSLVRDLLELGTTDESAMEKETEKDNMADKKKRKSTDAKQKDQEQLEQQNTFAKPNNEPEKHGIMKRGSHEEQDSHSGTHVKVSGEEGNQEAQQHHVATDDPQQKKSVLFR